MEITYIKPVAYHKQMPLNQSFINSNYELHSLDVLAENVGQSDFGSIVGDISKRRKQSPTYILPDGLPKGFEINLDEGLNFVGVNRVKAYFDEYRSMEEVTIELMANKTPLKKSYGRRLGRLRTVKQSDHEINITQIVQEMNQPPYLSINGHGVGSYDILWEVLAKYKFNLEVIDAKPNSVDRSLLKELLLIPMTIEEVKAARRLLPHLSEKKILG